MRMCLWAMRYEKFLKPASEIDRQKNVTKIDVSDPK
jgi:hypothetical protein